MGIGENIRKRRRALGYTLEDVAHHLCTTRQTIQRYESGVISNIPNDKIAQIADFLATTPAALVGWEDDAEDGSRAALMPLRMRRVPMLGDIACGEPIWVEEEHGSYVAVDGKLNVDFCLRAHGDSMIGARILDGDVVFIRAQEMEENGKIAAVIIDNEATLKRWYYFPEKQKLILTPENPAYEPLVFIGDELSDIKCIGQAVSVMSRL